jgi:hypothetical protein
MKLGQTQSVKSYAHSGRAGKTFDLATDYLQWAIADWSNRSLITRLLDQCRESAKEGNAVLPAGLLHSLSEVKFVQILVCECSVSIEDTLGRCRERLARVKSTLDLIDLLLGAAVRAPVSVSEVDPNLQTDQAESIIRHLYDARTAIMDTLSDVLARRLAERQISDKHCAAEQFLFARIEADMETVRDDAIGCAELHNRLLVEPYFIEKLEGSQIEIDSSALHQSARDQAAVTVANLPAYADAMMRSIFGDLPQAFKRLNDPEVVPTEEESPSGYNAEGLSRLLKEVESFQRR